MFYDDSSELFVAATVSVVCTVSVIVVFVWACRRDGLNNRMKNFRTACMGPLLVFGGLAATIASSASATTGVTSTSWVMCSVVDCAFDANACLPLSTRAFVFSRKTIWFLFQNRKIKVLPWTVEAAVCAALTVLFLASAALAAIVSAAWEALTRLFLISEISWAKNKRNNYTNRGQYERLLVLIRGHV